MTAARQWGAASAPEEGAAAVAAMAERHSDAESGSSLYRAHRRTTDGHTEALGGDTVAKPPPAGARERRLRVRDAFACDEL